MKIYLDLIIILNFIFDLIILLGVNYILKRNASLPKCLISSAIGTLTLFILFWHIKGFFLVIYKLIISIFMILTSFGYKDLKYFFKNIIYFYLVSMLLGGAVTALNNQFSYSNNGLIFTKRSLGSTYIVIITLSLFLFFKYLKAFQYLKINYQNYYKCKIYFDSQNYITVNAFLDTGNKLQDPYSSKSIILLMQEKLKKFPKYNPIYVPYNSLNNHGLLTCYKVDHLEINGKTSKKFLIGISNQNFFMDGIECILNNQIMEELK